MSEGIENPAFVDKNERNSDGTTINPIVQNKDGVTVLSMSEDGSTIKAVSYSFISVEDNAKKTSEPNGIALEQFPNGSSNCGKISSRNILQMIQKF